MKYLLLNSPGDYCYYFNTAPGVIQLNEKIKYIILPYREYFRCKVKTFAAFIHSGK